MAVVPQIPRYFFDDAGWPIETERADLGEWIRVADVEAVFIPGVVYMPVPRCDQCRFWHRDSGTADMGDCRVFSDDPNIAPHIWPTIDKRPKPLAFVAPFAGADGGGFITQPDFGCVQWEAKA